MIYLLIFLLFLAIVFVLYLFSKLKRSYELFHDICKLSDKSSGLSFERMMLLYFAIFTTSQWNSAIQAMFETDCLVYERNKHRYSAEQQKDIELLIKQINWRGDEDTFD